MPVLVLFGLRNSVLLPKAHVPAGDLTGGNLGDTPVTYHGKAKGVYQGNSGRSSQFRQKSWAL